MLCRTVGALAALSMGANAILLPPSVTEMADSLTDALGFAADPKSQSFKLPCPSCVFPSSQKESVAGDDGGDDLVWIQGNANDVVFNFTVTDDNKAVLLNGAQLYPVDPYSLIEPTVGQVSSSSSLADIKSHPEKVTPLRVTQAAVEVNQEVVSPNNDMIVRIDYQIGGLELQPMHLPGVELKLLENPDGALMIISVDATPKDLLPFIKGDKHAPHSAPANNECKMLPAALCKWKSAVESKLSGLKPSMPHALGGCRGRGGRKPNRLPGHIKPHLETDAKPAKGDRPHGEHPHPHPHGERPHKSDKEGDRQGRPHKFDQEGDRQGRPHKSDKEGDRQGRPHKSDKDGDRQGRPHHHHGDHPHNGPHGMHHGGHHGHHHFLHSFVRAFVAVLIPVMAGITMGMFVSLIGMLVGRLIGFVWIKFRRGGQRGYASLAQSDEQTESMEKGVVVEDIEEEPLPKYEDAPAYDEKEQN